MDKLDRIIGDLDPDQFYCKYHDFYFDKEQYRIYPPPCTKESNIAFPEICHSCLTAFNKLLKDDNEQGN